MTEDNDESEAEALTFSEMMETAATQIEAEVEGFDGEDPPKHAGRLLAQRATDLLGTLTNMDVAEARNDVDDFTDEEVAEALSEDAVEIVLALGALQYEYDLDIEAAFRERKEMVEAVQNAETMEEVIEATMGEDVLEEFQNGGIEPGDDVSSDDFEGTPGRGVA